MKENNDLAQEQSQILCNECKTVLVEASEIKRVLYGSPFCKCEKCGHEYVDPRKREIIADGIYIAHRLYVPIWKLVFTLLALLVTGIAASGMLGWYIGFEIANIVFEVAALVLVLAICMDVTSLIEYAKRRGFLKEEKARSRERMSNPEYVKRLQTLGKRIPKSYLPKVNEKEIKSVFKDAD